MPLTRPARTSNASPCDCPSHQATGHAAHNDSPSRGWLSLLVPAIACAICPACLGVWAPLLTTLGVGIVLTEGQHGTLLVLAVALSIGLAAIRVNRGGALAPFSMTATGGAILIAGHWLQESRWLSLLAVSFLVGGSLFARHSNRRSAAVIERLET